MEKEIEYHIANGLMKVSQALKTGDWEKFSEKGITPTQKQILVYLYKRKRGVETSLTDLVNHLVSTPATVSDIVQKMINKDLLKKNHALDDKRKIVIQLTPKGKALSKQAEEWSNFLISSVQELGEDEKKIVLKALLKIVKNLQDQGKVSFVRMCLTCQYFRPNQHKDPNKPHHCSFIDAPLAHEQLRLDCSDHEQVESAEIQSNWNIFLKTE